MLSVLVHAKSIVYTSIFKHVLLLFIKHKTKYFWKLLKSQNILMLITFS